PRHGYLPPAFPAFFFSCSPAYRMPLFLYGSGFLNDRMFAAIWPTCWRSTPEMDSFVCLSTVMLMPAGIGYSIGCEYPSVKTTELGLISTFTLSGIGMGFLPIRDIVPSVLSLLNKCCRAARRRSLACGLACRS